MRPTTRTYLYVAAAVALLCASGCSYVYTFDLSVVVRNAADGTPLQEVRVARGWGFPEEVPESIGETDGSGRVTHTFSVPINFFESGAPEHWPLTLEKDGFVTEVVDIKPSAAPKKYGSTTPVFVVAYMRPVK